MTSDTDAAALTLVTESRGQRIRARRQALKIYTFHKFQKVSTEHGVKVDRRTLAAAEKDVSTVQDSSYKEIEDALDVLEEVFNRKPAETGDVISIEDAPSMSEVTDSDLVEIQLHGLYGIEEVVIKGSASHEAEMAELIDQIVRRSRVGATSDPESTT
jgi:transcriptional regulator with XRE-family HTH domain